MKRNYSPICVPVREKSMAKALMEIQRVAHYADLIEIWMDQIEDLNIDRLFTVKRKPYVCVYKSKRERGKFTGLTENRIKVLQHCIELKAEYIDFNIEAPMRWIKLLASQKKATQLILSHHNFLKTPSFKVLARMASRMVRLGADVCKIVTTVNSKADIAALFQLADVLEEKRIRYIILGMGLDGRITRYYSPLLNNEMVFAPLVVKTPAVDGEIAADQLKKIWNNIF